MCLDLWRKFKGYLHSRGLTGEGRHNTRFQRDFSNPRRWASCIIAVGSDASFINHVQRMRADGVCVSGEVWMVHRLVDCARIFWAKGLIASRLTGTFDRRPLAHCSLTFSLFVRRKERMKLMPRTKHLQLASARVTRSWSLTLSQPSSFSSTVFFFFSFHLIIGSSTVFNDY